jgi:hypothetical protein
MRSLPKLGTFGAEMAPSSARGRPRFVPPPLAAVKSALLPQVGRLYAADMATREDLRRIALSLPETATDNDGFSYGVAGKAIVWTWLERVHPKKARVPNPVVIAVRVSDESEKELLIDMDPTVFFTEPHYHGYPAILVRLTEIDVVMLETLVRTAWRLRAPKALRSALDQPDS